MLKEQLFAFYKIISFRYCALWQDLICLVWWYTLRVWASRDWGKVGSCKTLALYKDSSDALDCTDLERTTGTISQFTSTEKLFRVRARLAVNLLHAIKEYPDILAPFRIFNLKIKEGLGVQPWSSPVELVTSHPGKYQLFPLANARHPRTFKAKRTQLDTNYVNQ